VLSVQEGARRFACNRRRRVAKPTLDEGVAEIVRTRFGEAFLARLIDLL
jgi:protoporphyrinogen oxidase